MTTAQSTPATPATPTRWRIPARYDAALLVVAIRHAKSHPLDTYTPRAWTASEMSAAEYLAWFRARLHEKITALGARETRPYPRETHILVVRAKGYSTRAQAMGRERAGAYAILPIGTPLRRVGRQAIYQAYPWGQEGTPVYSRLLRCSVRAVEPAVESRANSELRLSRVRRHRSPGRKLHADYQTSLYRGESQ